MPATLDERIDAAFVPGGRTVASDPYLWPFDGDLRPANTAIVVIDMQVDFCAPGGYVDSMGYDLSLTRAPIEPIARLLKVARAKDFTVIHTREGHKPDLSDLPANKRWRSQRIGAGIGDQGPCGRILVRGEPGWEIIPELQPVAGEAIIDKPGKGSFLATDFELVLRTKGIRNLVLTGVTTDVCVHTTMRDANDRGYECLVLSDCTGATKLENHLAALDMVKMQGGVFGAVAMSDALIAAIG
ncbi:cysteine hydrolase [Jiella sp. MQZ9-1]|uniref:Cysteine hydrolase n=1 Tax=Jiella flava TaxID=2816857 RepID=A0A939FVL8_9HYPH|nr:isochorismatase family cysteine hydrolase [Jiella flava]MBO0660985.1 cysteine hydrolase [Jiella flava]MCD2469633.1 cysteine hydrolase [Jiella flava]